MREVFYNLTVGDKQYIYDNQGVKEAATTTYPLTNLPKDWQIAVENYLSRNSQNEIVTQFILYHALIFGFITIDTSNNFLPFSLTISQ